MEAVFIAAGVVTMLAAGFAARALWSPRDTAQDPETQDDFTLALRRGGDRMERMGK